METADFAKFIKEKSGLNIKFSDYLSLEKKIDERMSKSSIGNTNQYYQTIRTDLDEFAKLAGSLTVNETYFFREHRHFDLIISHVIPPILAKDPTKKITIF